MIGKWLRATRRRVLLNRISDARTYLTLAERDYQVAFNARAFEAADEAMRRVRMMEARIDVCTRILRGMENSGHGRI